jgi:hypothetical protein
MANNTREEVTRSSECTDGGNGRDPVAMLRVVSQKEPLVPRVRAFKHHAPFDRLRPARGFVLGFIIAIGLWLVIGLACWALFW